MVFIGFEYFVLTFFDKNNFSSYIAKTTVYQLRT